jgi:hypothetical protein
MPKTLGKVERAYARLKGEDERLGMRRTLATPANHHLGETNPRNISPKNELGGGLVFGSQKYEPLVVESGRRVCVIVSRLLFTMDGATQTCQQ